VFLIAINFYLVFIQEDVVLNALILNATECQKDMKIRPISILRRDGLVSFENISKDVQRKLHSLRLR
jgi:hypothetical protein